MKTPIRAVLAVTILAMLAGCMSPRQSNAEAREREIRKQLADSVPMREYGYTIKEFRFSPNHNKALVLFTHTDSKMRPDWEFILTEDDFGRYVGRSMQPFYTPGTSNTPAIPVMVIMPR